MHQTDAFALAARLYVAIRQKLGRITDVEWMLKNDEYAEEVIRLAKSQVGAEIADLADKFAAVLASRSLSPHTGPLASQVSAPIAIQNTTAGRRSEDAGHEEPAHRYVGRLR